MKILVLGSGGREHALVWKLSQSPLVSRIFVAPGNAGTEHEGCESVPIKVDDCDGLVHFAREQKIDLVVPGPELPLTLGITDRMRAAGIPCFGPDAYAARLEGSKSFAKEVMQKAGVPTADFRIVRTVAEAEAAIDAFGVPVVVKADGLAAGKGVVVAQSREEALASAAAMLEEHAFGQAGETVVIEECLRGEEVSLLCLCAGEQCVPLDSAQDHKAAFDNDQGPNTGGMGAYSPAPILPSSELNHFADLTVRPILRVLKEAGHPFVGVLYAGLMVSQGSPRVLEYNVRFGDPECQILLTRLESDLAAHLCHCVQGEIKASEVRFTPQSGVGVVVAAKGYPGSYPKGMLITGLEECEAAGVKVFHSGTVRDSTGAVRASGGRILCVTGLGVDLRKAKDKVYHSLRHLAVEESFYRSDIGAKGIAHLES